MYLFKLLIERKPPGVEVF